MKPRYHTAMTFGVQYFTKVLLLLLLLLLLAIQNKARLNMLAYNIMFLAYVGLFIVENGEL